MLNSSKIVLKIIETHIVPALSGEIRLQEYGVSIFKSIITKSGLKKAIKRKELLIDGVLADTGDWMRPGQKIELLQQEIIPRKVFKLKLELVYEDDFLAVVNKPPGYPTSGNYFKTIENALNYNLNGSSQHDVLPYPLPVHRLDAPTAGLLIIAKTRNAQISLNSAFENKKILKTYHAVVHGTPPEEVIYSNQIDGKNASSHIHTIQQKTIRGEEFSLVKVIPYTGRTHQIRLHLSLNNFPIVGDREHGRPEDPFSKKGLYLASTGLNFPHPESGETVDLQLPVPAKFLVFR